MINQEEFEHTWRNAKQIALVAHHQQMRGDEPYVNHPLRVAHSCIAIWNDPYATVAGILHDTLEDSSYTEETLLLMGVDPDVVDVVKLVTREQGIGRDDYIQRLIDSENIPALRVKLMDAIDNSVWSYANVLRYGDTDERWKSGRIYYRRLVLKLWSVYQVQTDAHAPDEDKTFINRVIHRWNELDDISIRLIKGEVVSDEEIDVRMLDVIADTARPQSSSWIEDAIDSAINNQTV